MTTHPSCDCHLKANLLWRRYGRKSKRYSGTVMRWLRDQTYRISRLTSKQTIALAVSNAGTLMATACKSTTPEHALIRLYDTERFLPYGEPLSGHSLTIVRIVFNRDDRLILSVSKDRTWCLFERTKSWWLYMNDYRCAHLSLQMGIRCAAPQRHMHGSSGTVLGCTKRIHSSPLAVISRWVFVPMVTSSVTVS